MSKSALKEELSKLSIEQLIAHVLDLYEKNNAIKEFYNFFFNPSNEKELAIKYKKIIRKEFNVENPTRSTEKFSVAKRAISDFKNLKPSPEIIADVMRYLPESCCELTYCYVDFSEQFYNATNNNFKTTLEFIARYNLEDQFKSYTEQYVKWTSPCGYGFADDIGDIYYKYYASN